jgi:hypothetical protein
VGVDPCVYCELEHRVRYHFREGDYGVLHFQDQLRHVSVTYLLRGLLNVQSVTSMVF